MNTGKFLLEDKILKVSGIRQWLTEPTSAFYFIIIHIILALREEIDLYEIYTAMNLMGYIL